MSVRVLLPFLALVTALVSGASMVQAKPKAKTAQPSAEDPFTQSVKEMKLPPSFHQKCFSAPRKLEIVKASMILQAMELQQAGSSFEQALNSLTEAPFKALVIGTNMAVLCRYAPGNGNLTHQAPVGLGYCEEGLAFDDCTVIEELSKAMNQLGGRIERRDNALPAHIQEIAPGLSI